MTLPRVTFSAFRPSLRSAKDASVSFTVVVVVVAVAGASASTAVSDLFGPVKLPPPYGPRLLEFSDSTKELKRFVFNLPEGVKLKFTYARSHCYVASFVTFHLYEILDIVECLPEGLLLSLGLLPRRV